MNMGVKKRVNGDWVDAPCYIYKTAADTFTDLPVSIISTDADASIGLKGNIQQNGTPTPDAPVDVQGVGERTKNLFDGAIEYGDINLNSGQNVANNVFVRTKNYIPVTNTIYSISRSIATGYTSFRLYDANKNYIGYPNESTIRIIVGSIPNLLRTGASFACFEIIDPSIKYIRFRDETLSLDNKYMIVQGEYTSETMPKYEPYGYKIPVATSADGAEPITTPIYLPTPLYADEVLRSDGSREVKWGKIVLTGEENFATASSGESLYYRLTLGSYGSVMDGQCMTTHYEPATILASTTTVGAYVYNSSSANIAALNIRPQDVTTAMNTVEKFKTYLASQYAAGAPVTVWYQLATSTIETFIAQQIPTLNGITVIDVDTAVKPSEISLDYSGWHPAVVHERINGAWVAKS